MTAQPKMIDDWFPCAAVDQAVGTPEGSGLSEKAIFTWFASRPIAQARGAVLAALLPDKEELRPVVNRAIRGDRAALHELGTLVTDSYPARRPVVLDPFSGRGIIALEVARIGGTAVGTDLSPLATLAGRLLADYPLRDWSSEPALPLASGEAPRRLVDGEPRLLADLRVVLQVIGERVRSKMAQHYPQNPDGTLPWGYIWAITIPCDGCRRRFPLIGSLVLRHPYKRTDDPGQAFRLVVDKDRGTTKYEVYDGVPDQQPPLASTGGRRTGRCPFCDKSHSLETIKQLGKASQYEDVPVLAVDAQGDRKVFRPLRGGEAEAATTVTLDDVGSFGAYPAVPDERIPPGNEDTVRPSGYGYRSYGELMNRRQTLQVITTVRAIRDVRAELVTSGLSTAYAEAMAAYAAATLVRKMRYSTRGASLRSLGKPDGSQQNRVKVNDIFAAESKVSFSFDYFEAGIGAGPGTWSSIVETGLTPLARHVRGLAGTPGRFRQASAMALPFRDGTVDAVVTDPPYYNMIDYSDASDLFFVWLKRALFDIVPDLFGDDSGLQPKDEEIIVKRGNAPGEHRTKVFYEASLAKSFAECRRVLRPDGSLVLVFGHSDPDAWKRLLGGLHDAGFVVTRTWPSRTESANTGVASIKVTVTIGCRLAAATRPTATAAQVDREVAATVKAEVPQWETDGLALTDQLMAAYGPAMEVCGRYARIIQPDDTEAPIERYLTLARTAVRDAVALKIDEIPLETFDATTRFAIFWMRLYGQGNCPKSEARFLAQADGLRLDQVRGGLLVESKAGYKITLRAPAAVRETSPIFDVVRGMVAAQPDGSDAIAQVLADAGRSPDDEHVWAVVSELTHRLPANAAEAKALTAIQRTADTIQSQVRGLATAKAYAEGQITLFESET